MNIKSKIKNWKLIELLDKIEIVAEDSIEEREILIDKLSLPRPKSIGLNRSETNVNWNAIPNYYKFFFDRNGYEKIIEQWLRNSEILQSKSLIITYGWKEPMIKVAAELFFEDWEGFIRSTLWETIIFSDDYKLIMEVSRDYYLHSNFEIMPNSKVF